MATIATTNQYCPKCGKTMAAEKNFFLLRTGERSDLCKACETMHVNNYKPESFMWLLEKYDVPWVPRIWNKLLDKAYQKDPYKINGLSVFGKYLSQMKTKQWSQYRFKDTQQIQDEENQKQNHYIAQNEEKLKQLEQSFLEGIIPEAQYLTYKAGIIDAGKDYSQPPPLPPELPAETDAKDAQSKDSAYPVNSHFEEVELPDESAELSLEEKQYLALKWGRYYTAADWVWLEKKYDDFMHSFTIEGAARLDTLVMICKTSLKMNQAIDCGDIENYQKLSRVYDSMMKAAKFQEVQISEDKVGDFDSIGQIVALAETEEGGGAISRHKIDTPLDVVDESLDKMKKWNRSFIDNDSTLANQFEIFMKKILNNQEAKKNREEAKAKGLDKVELSDEDFIKFNELEEDLSAADKEMLEGEKDELS